MHTKVMLDPVFIITGSICRFPKINLIPKFCSCKICCIHEMSLECKAVRKLKQALRGNSFGCPVGKILDSPMWCFKILKSQFRVNSIWSEVFHQSVPNTLHLRLIDCCEWVTSDFLKEESVGEFVVGVLDTFWYFRGKNKRNSVCEITVV